LVLANQKAVADYDKTVITLSGGALGVSFVFLEKFGGQPGNVIGRWWLMWSWFSWTASLCCVLWSFYWSHCAILKSIRDFDDGKMSSLSDDERTRRRPGGWRGSITERLTVAGGILFVVGVVLIARFAYMNLGGKSG
jgi:hypothetical protein